MPKKEENMPAKKKRAATKGQTASGNAARSKTAEPRGKDNPAPTTEPKGEVPLANLEEVAAMLKLSPLQVRQMVQTGRIPGVKVDGEWRFNKDLVFEAIHRRSRGF